MCCESIAAVTMRSAVRTDVRPICLLIVITLSAVSAVLTYPLNDGGEIPAIALGTSLGHTADGRRILSVNYSLARAVQWALEVGYKHIDTAAIYQAEEEVGLGIQNFLRDNNASRDDVYVTTKLWNTDHEVDAVVPALRKSLADLRLDYIDMYLMHYPMAYMKNGSISDTDYLETWKGIETTKDTKLARSIGVSNFNITQMKRLWDHSRIKPAVLQIEVNPTITQSELIEWCQEKGVVVMAYSPFGGILGRSDDAPEPHADHPVLVGLSEKYHKTVPQILLRYLMDRKLVPIPRSTNKDRIVQNLNILDFSLTPEEVATLSSFNSDYRVRDRKKWYLHPHYPYEKKNVTEEEIKKAFIVSNE